MSNPVFLVSIAERRSRVEMDFQNMSATQDSEDGRLSLINVVAACVVALLLAALIIILVVAYIRAKSKTEDKKLLSGTETVESSLESIAINNNSYGTSPRLTDSLFACTSDNRYCYESIVAV